MAYDPKSAPVDPAGPALHQLILQDQKEMYRNLGIEISSLPDTAKYDKVCDFLRRNANVYVDMNELAEQIQYVSSRTLSRWMLDIRKSAQVQPLVPAVGAQGMAPNVVVRKEARPSSMLYHARQPQTGST